MATDGVVLVAGGWLPGGMSPDVAAAGWETGGAPATTNAIVVGLDGLTEAGGRAAGLAGAFDADGFCGCVLDGASWVADEASSGEAGLALAERESAFDDAGEGDGDDIPDCWPIGFESCGNIGGTTGLAAAPSGAATV